MPRKSNLVLTQEQELALVKYAMDRLTQLEADNLERFKADKQSWKDYANDAAGRETDQNTVFSRKNIHLPLTSMVIEHFMSRAEEAVADVPPYFQFKPVGSDDDEKAKLFNGYYNWKLDTKGRCSVTLKDAMLPIFVQRATILKSAFFLDTAEWVDRDRDVLFDLQTGQPIEIPGRGPIIKGEDTFEQRPDAAAMRPEGTPEEQWTPPMRSHLKADPTFIFDAAKHKWGPVPTGLKRSEVLYRGAKSVLIDSDSFLCPSTGRNVQDPEMIAEQYDRGLDWYKNMWLDRPWAPASNVAAEFGAGDATPKTDTEAKKDSKENLAFDTINPKHKTIECWIRRDVCGLGKPQEFVLFLNRDKQKAIWYEYQAKVTQDFKRPYTSISLGKTKYWQGPSIPEKVFQFQTEADKQFNGELSRNEKVANPITGGDPTALEDEPDKLQFDAYAYYKTKTGRALKEAVQLIEFPDVETRTQAILDYIVYMVQLWLGVSSLAQGDYSAAPADATNFGIEKTLSESSKINKRWIRRIIDAFEEHLTKLVKIELSTTEDKIDEEFQYVDGDQTKLAIMTSVDKRTLDVNVTLVLGQNQDANTIKRADAALNVQERYFAQLDPNLRLAMRPLLVDVLESLGYRNTDKLLPAPTPEEIAQFDLQASGAVPAPGAAPGQPDASPAPLA